MYLDVDFGRDESVDEARVITTYDIDHTRVQLESASPADGWEKIADKPRLMYQPVPQGIRRMATYEIAARGVHFLMLRGTDYGAEDVAGDPEAWGLKVIGHDHEAALYQTIW
jgi:hypothetical protein